MLEIKNVSKSFKDFTVLRDVNLTFDRGVYGLLSPNGAGKTTLIKMIVTLLHPDSGEILWNGENIASLDGSYRELVGYLPQKFGYYRDDSPMQFLTYMAALNGVDSAVAKERCQKLLERVGLGDVTRKKMKKFSGGMIQRVGIVNALMNDPQIVIFDEPTAGLDPMERVRFRHILAELGKTKIVILSTHIVSDIENIADQVVMIKDHEVYACDTIEAILKAHNADNLETAFMKIYGGEALEDAI